MVTKSEIVGDRCVNRRSTPNERSKALLAGLLFDEQGAPLKPVHTSKLVPGKPESAKRRYRYYIEQAEPRGEGSNRPPALRIPAGEIEPLVRAELKALFERPLSLIERAKIDVPASMLPAVEARARRVAATLGGNAQPIVRKALDRVTIHPDRVILELSIGGIAKLLGLPQPVCSEGSIAHSIYASLKRSGMAVRFIEANGRPVSTDKVDLGLVMLIHQARTWWAELAKGELNIANLARKEKVTRSYVTRILRLAFLSPELNDAILDG